MPAKKQFETIDEYIKTFPKDVQSILEKMRQTIKRAAPEAEETISYQIPTFKLKGSSLVHFAAFRKHIGLYRHPKNSRRKYLHTKVPRAISNFRPINRSLTIWLRGSFCFERRKS